MPTLSLKYLNYILYKLEKENNKPGSTMKTIIKSIDYNVKYTKPIESMKLKDSSLN